MEIMVLFLGCTLYFVAHPLLSKEQPYHLLALRVLSLSLFTDMRDQLCHAGSLFVEWLLWVGCSFLIFLAVGHVVNALLSNRMEVDYEVVHLICFQDVHGLLYIRRGLATSWSQAFEVVALLTPSSGDGYGIQTCRTYVEWKDWDDIH